VPRVYLTEQQRNEAANLRLRQCIGDHIAKKMNRKKLNRTQTAALLEINTETLKKLLNGEDAQLPTSKFLKVFSFAGLSLTAIPDELEAALRKKT